jgi:chromosome partitioning protein
VGDIIACANQKGGVGKTTTVINLAAYLALSDRRVLVVDLDPQGNATSGLGLDRSAPTGSIYAALLGDRSVGDLARPTQVENLWMVPSGADLAGAEVELISVGQRERRLQHALDEVRDRYDFILLDCPPAVGLLTVNALTAADGVLVPIQCEYYALEGLSQLLSTINLVRDNLNPRLKVAGVLLTMFDARTTLSADVAKEVRRHLGSTVFDAIIPRSVRLAEAPSYGRPIVRYSPESRGAQAYSALADEVLQRHSNRPRPTEATPEMAVTA